MNYHVEVHTKWNEVEHFVCLNCENEAEAQERVIAHYKERDVVVTTWAEAKENTDIGYYIFSVNELKDKPAIYIAGEYKSNYPI